MAEARAARRAARASRSQQPRRDRATTRPVFWHELALVIVCLQIAVFILAFDPNLLNAFDLTKASYTHALAWGLLGALVVIALSGGVRVPMSPLFVAFYAVLGVEMLTTLTAENQYVAVYGEVGRYLGLTTHAVLALVAIAIAVSLDYPRRATWLAWVIGLAAALAGLYAIQQALGLDPVHWADTDSSIRPFSSFGNADFYGQFIAVVAVACGAVLAFARPSRPVAVLVTVLGVASLGLMVIVATRGSVVGIIAGSATVATLWLHRTGISRRRLIQLGLAVGVASLALVVTSRPSGSLSPDPTRRTPRRTTGSSTSPRRPGSSGSSRTSLSSPFSRSSPGGTRATKTAHRYSSRSPGSPRSTAVASSCRARRASSGSPGSASASRSRASSAPHAP